jgi:2-methylcitrate dehydratase PrpD
VKEMSVSDRLAARITDISYEKLPQSTISKAKLCILDLFGAHFAGYRIEPCNAVRGYISYVKGDAQATVWSTGERTSCTEAAFANSAISHVTVFDDMHAYSASHYGAIVIPASLALGEYLGCSGKDLITSMVAGYEAGIRVGAAITSPFFAKSGFRPSGAFGVIGSAAAASRLFGLSSSQMVNAIGLAANFGAGLMAWANDGTDDSMYQPALGSRNGMLSAMLAKSGAVAPSHVFEIKGGFAIVYAGDSEAAQQIVANPDSPYKIEEVYFKPIPACAFVQSAARATLQVADTRNFEVEDITKIEVRTFPLGKHYPGLDYHGPFHGIMQAQMSTPFTIASIIAKGHITFEDYTKLDDPIVQALATKVNITVDEEATCRFPGEQCVKVEVFLKDGSSRKAASNNPHFLTPDEVLAKCRLYLNDALGHKATDRFVEMVQSIELVDNVNALTDIIRLNFKAPCPLAGAASKT